jgi:hypothetical protein
MLIIGLMVIALICLAVGLALPSSAWLIASLIATAGAGYLVWKMRSAIAPAAAAAGTSAELPAGADADARADGLSRADDTDTDADGDIRNHTDSPADSHVDSPADSPAVTTTMPRITDDVIEVPAARGSDDATQVMAAVAARSVDDVWVIDGRPRYHLGSCPIIQGQEAEPIPLDQAIEDGFMPCSLCEPTMAHTSR